MAHEIWRAKLLRKRSKFIEKTFYAMPNPNFHSSNSHNIYQNPRNTRTNRSFSYDKDVQPTQPLHELSFVQLLNRRIFHYWKRTNAAFIFATYKMVDAFWWFLYHNWFKTILVLIVGSFLLTKTQFVQSPIPTVEKTKKTTAHNTIFGTSSNPFAPVSAAELVEKQAYAYIQRYSPTAIAEMEHFGIPASIQLAQGLVESRAGNSKLAQTNNNHFGIKCFSKSCPKGHCSNFTDDHHKDFFRKFPSAWESWREHSKLLSNDYYKRLHQSGRDYKKWAAGLHQLGYATDPQYEEKIVGMVEKYELYKYDSR
jgi:flagellum-specific peptidoglycan hydrolase FlgJ